MTSINFFQVGKTFHCLICHKDIGTDRLSHWYGCAGKASGCTSKPECEKWKGNYQKLIKGK